MVDFLTVTVRVPWSLIPASLCFFQAQLEAQRATQDFQRATEVLRAAKETISLAEQRLLEDDKRQFDSAWQEMLNHATQRVIGACPSICLRHVLCPPVVHEA